MENKFIAIINWILGIVFFVTFAGVLVSDNLNGLIIGGGLFVLLLLVPDIGLCESARLILRQSNG